MLVGLYQVLLETTKHRGDELSLTGTIDLAGDAGAADEWPRRAYGSAPLELALLAGSRFAKIYSNGRGVVQCAH